MDEVFQSWIMIFTFQSGREKLPIMEDSYLFPILEDKTLPPLGGV